MFAAPFNRILWKEYRAHKSLWLIGLVIGVLAQLLTWWFDTDVHDRAFVLSATPAAIAILFAIGSGAILFVNEREERTSDWLLSLSAPPLVVLSAKFAFAVIATWSLQIALAIISLLLISNAPTTDLEFVLLVSVPAGLIALVWSIFGSLLSRRGLVSVPMMFFWYLVTVGTPFLLLERLDFNFVTSGSMSIVYGVFASIVVSVLVADVWLGWRWCQGKYLDGSVIENLNARHFSWKSQLPLGGTGKSRLPRRAEYEQPWRRTWQRLVWQERCGESLHLLMLTAGCAAGGMLALAAASGLFSATIAIMIWCYAIPFLMGIVGFRADSSLHQPRFLAQRGVASSSLWLAKQVVWLPRAFWIPSAIFTVSLLFETLLVDKYVGGNSTLSQLLIRALWERADLAIWFVVLSYCSGQLVGLLSRRTILAILFGAILSGLCVVLLFDFSALAIPQWWSLGLPVLALLSITLWQMHSWMIEDQSWSRWLKLWSVLIATPILLMTVVAIHRIAEVTRPFQLNQSLVDLFHRSQLAQLQPQQLSTEEQGIVHRLELLSEAEPAEDQVTADTLVKLISSEISGFRIPDKERQRIQLGKLSHFLANRTAELTKLGQLREALDCVLASLKLERICSNSPHQTSSLEELMNWANQPSQTSTSIRLAMKEIQAELKQFSATEEIVANYLQDRKAWVLSSRIEVLNELNFRHTSPGFRDVSWRDTQQPIMMTALLPWERIRLDRLMTHEAELLFAATWSLETRLSSPIAAYQSVRQEFSGWEAMRDQLARTTFCSRFSHVTLNSALFRVLDRQTQIRAFLTRMALIAYRLDAKALPERLIELLPTLDGINLIDPWSGHQFEYYPSFLMSAGSENAALVPVSTTEVAIRKDDNFSSAPRWNYREVLSESVDRQTLREDKYRMLFPIPPRQVQP